MNVEIRPCRDRDEMAAYTRTVSYVFASTEGMNEELESTLPEWTTCAFVDGEMATTLGAFPFTVRLNGAPVRMGGVTAVGTLPGQRRRGLLRQVMKHALATMHEREQDFAILWASMGAIYQRFGYGQASRHVRYTFDPRFAGFESHREETGTVALVAKDDAFPVMKQLYIRYATPRNLHIHRSTVLWNLNTLRPRKPGEPMYTAIYRDGDGEPQGHLVYRTFEGDQHTPGSPGQVMQVTDFVALTMDAYRGLWEYIRRHDLVGRVEMSGCVGEDDPAPDLLLEPRVLQRWTGDGIWMRVVDLEQGLPRRPYSARGALTFAVPADDLCPWNAGTWEMETSGASTEVRRSARTPGLVIPMAALASLVSGMHSATHLARAGRIEAADESALETADLVFRTAYRPNCPNDF